MRVVSLSEVGLMTVADAAEFHGVTVEAVRLWIRADRIPVVVVSEGTTTPRHLLRVKDVESFVKPPRGAPTKPGRKPKSAPPAPASRPRPAPKRGP
jgi:hypothetical protein